MIFFSELEGKAVVSVNGTFLGKITDVIFFNSEMPVLTKAVFRNKEAESVIVPFGLVKKLNSELILDNNINISLKTESELSVKESLLDKQVIDLVGNKVVRVNDVVINDKPNYYVAGIDTSFLGILRRLGLLQLLVKNLRIIKNYPQTPFLSWADIRNLEVDHGFVKMKKREEKLKKIHAEDLADYLEMTNIKNVKRFLNTLDKEKAAEVFKSLNISYQLSLLDQFDPKMISSFLEFSPADEAADILLNTPKEKRDLIIGYLPYDKQQNLVKLMYLSSTPIGDVMSSNYMTVKANETVETVIRRLRDVSGETECVYTVFVLNELSQLVGIFTLHEMLTQPQNTPAYKFMIQNPIVTHLTSSLDLAIKKMLRYKLNTMPVIDEKKQVVGAINIDDLAEYLLEKLS